MEAEVIPVGYTVLVEPQEVKTTKGRIVLVTEDKKKLQEQAQVRAKVLAIGPDAFEDHGVGQVNVGDIVYHQRHAGMRLTDEYGDILMTRLLLKDTDIVAVVKSTEDK